MSIGLEGEMFKNNRHFDETRRAAGLVPKIPKNMFSWGGNIGKKKTHNLVLNSKTEKG